MAEKQYGLIKPQKPSTRLLAFASDSESDDEPAKKRITTEASVSQKRQTRVVHEDALKEDPTIFQYDEVYDDINATREEAKNAKATQVRESKYISRLLVTAEKRKLEHESRLERKIQKEREAEGDMYKDKEVFVTSSYRAKLEAFKKAEEEAKREEYLESIGDVRKQKDLSGFYRHMYEQKLGNAEKPKKDEEEEEKGENEKKEDKKSTTEKLDIKSSAASKRRAYRKHDDHVESEEEEEEEEEPSPNDNTKQNATERKKVHLQSNLDADSDFSIDSDDSECEDEKSKSDKLSNPSCNESKKIDEKASDDNVIREKPNEKNGVKAEASEKNDKNVDKKIDDGNNETDREMMPPPAPKPKIDVWKKRTVGDVYLAAVQRYYERKQSGSA